jgi:hypothetical protein
MAGIPEAGRKNLVQNLDMSFMSIDTRGNIIPKTPEAGYMAADAYMMATRPPQGDPRQYLYQTAMAGLGVMGAAIAGRDIGQPADPPRRNILRQPSRRRTMAATQDIQRDRDWGERTRRRLEDCSEPLIACCARVGF